MTDTTAALAANALALFFLVGTALVFLKARDALARCTRKKQAADARRIPRARRMRRWNLPRLG